MFLPETIIRETLECEKLQFRGFQKTHIPNNELVLFDNSFHSTISVKRAEFSVWKVKEALRKSEERWGKCLKGEIQKGR